MKARITFLLVLLGTLGLFPWDSQAQSLELLETIRNRTVDGLNQPRGVTVSPDGNHIYVVSYHDVGVSVFARQASTGRLTFVDYKRFPGLTLRADYVTVSPDGNHIYIAATYNDAVVVYARDASTGRITFIEVQTDTTEGVDGLDAANYVTVSPDGNHVYVTGSGDESVAVFNRDASTGKLTFLEIQKNGVDGVQGLVKPKSVTISPDGNHVYIASSDYSDNAVAVFARDVATGHLTFLTAYKNVNGMKGARFVTVSPDGYNVYIASYSDDAVVVFARDASTGRLSFVEVLKDGIGGVVGLNSARSITISPNGEHLYVASSDDNAVAHFFRDASTGRLTFIKAYKDAYEGFDGLYGAYSVITTPDSKHLYVAGYRGNEIAVIDRNIWTGQLSFIEVQKDNAQGIHGLKGAESIAMSPDGEHVYVAGGIDDAVAVFSRQVDTGRLPYFLQVQKNGVEGVSGLDGAKSVALSHNGKHVYVASEIDDAVAVFSRDPSTGLLTFVEAQKDGVDDVDGIDGAWSVTTSPDGAHVYVASFVDHAVTVFSRDDSNGALTFIETLRNGVEGAEGLFGARSVTVSPDGRYVYVASYMEDAISVFSRDAATGQLSFVEVQRDGVQGIEGLDGSGYVTVSSDGVYLYAAGFNDNAVAVFSCDISTGHLSFIEAQMNGIGNVDGIGGAKSIIISPDNKWTYVAGGIDDAIAIFSRDESTGQLSFVEAFKDGINGIDGLDGASSLAVTPDGKHLYVTGAADNAVAAFSVFSTTPGDTVDLSISSPGITFNPPFGTQKGRNVKISAKVQEEIGNHEAKCTVKFYYNDESNLIDSVTTRVAAGDTSVVHAYWNTANLAAGNYTIIAAIVNVYPTEINLSNNKTQKSYVIFDDQTPPSITFNSPIKDGFFPVISGEISLSFSDDEGSGVDPGSFRVSNNRDLGDTLGGKIISAGTDLAKFFNVTESGATWTVPDTMAFPTGQNTLTATVADSAGNQATTSVNFNVDFFVVTFPSDNAFLTQSPIKVKGFAVTPFVEKVVINGAEAPIDRERFEKEIDLNEGPNELVVVGYDSVNNVVKEIRIKVTLISTAPRVKITSPGSGRSFSYSPVQVKGTVSERYLVSVTINGIKAKISGANFIFGESRGQGLEIEEGEFWIKATAIDSAGSIGVDSVKISGVPPSPRRLYLKDDMLSWFPFPPYPAGTTQGYSYSLVFSEHSWKFPLKGDIDGSEYKFSLLVGCLGFGKATLKAQLILRHENRNIILASTSAFNGNTAGNVPLPPYYWPPQRREFNFTGSDPETAPGDTLIFKVTKVGGDRVGLIFIQELYLGHSWITIPPIEIDTIPPAPITDLEKISKTDTSATLRWTAPGDDGMSGKASKYEMRYTKVSSYTTGWWDNASTTMSVADMPTPSAPGTMDSVTVSPLDSGYTYIFAIKTADNANNWSEISNVERVTTPVKLSSIEIPRTFELSQNHPNPFNPETTIKYQLPKPSEVTVNIYNVVGQLVKILVDERQPAGYYSVNWNGKDETGRDVASGVYFYRLRAKDYVRTRKMVLVR